VHVLTPLFTRWVMPNLTEEFIANDAKPPAQGRTFYWDDKQKGFGLMVTATGHKTFVVQYRVKGQSRRMHLRGVSTVRDARDLAQSILGDVAKGRALRQAIDPLRERQQEDNIKSGKGTFKAIATEFFSRGEFAKQRSSTRRLAELERLVLPTIGMRQINEIKRTEITRLLDDIEDASGPGMADYILAIIRRVMAWHETRDDDFISPIRRGMAKTSVKKRKRKRILGDNELRAVWRAAEADTGPYGAMLRFILLTACRREEAAGMRRKSELSGTVWTIPAERYKTGVDHVIPLSPAAMAIVNKQRKLGKGDLVFTAEGRVPLCSFTYRKALFDKACGVSGWVQHDLRRTARSLMSRAKVNGDIAERCLGHIVGGVRETYDRHEYIDEKREAFEKLAALIEIIIAPKGDNVTSLDKRRATHKGVSQVPG
jgi:integrase